MKKIVLWLVVFACSFAIFDGLTGVFTDLLLAKSQFRYAKLYTKSEVSADVVVWGNSRAVDGFDVGRLSRDTGLHWVNMGYNGISPRIVEALALDYVERHKKPDIMVFEVSNILITRGLGQIRNLRVFERHSERLRKLDAQNDGVMAWLASRSALFAGNGEMFFRMIYYIGGSDQSWGFDGNISPVHAEELINAASKMVSIEALDCDIQAYRRLFSALTQRGVKCCAVCTPVLLNQEGYEHLRKAIASIVGKNVYYIDSAHVLQEYKWFSDTVHINNAGRAVYSELLEKDLSPIL